MIDPGTGWLFTSIWLLTGLPCNYLDFTFGWIGFYLLSSLQHLDTLSAILMSIFALLCIIFLNFFSNGFITDELFTSTSAKTASDSALSVVPTSHWCPPVGQASTAKATSDLIWTSLQRSTIVAHDQDAFHYSPGVVCMELPMWAPMWETTCPLPRLPKTLDSWSPTFESTQKSASLYAAGRVGLNQQRPKTRSASQRAKGMGKGKGKQQPSPFLQGTASPWPHQDTSHAPPPVPLPATGPRGHPGSGRACGKGESQTLGERSTARLPAP